MQKVILRMKGLFIIQKIYHLVGMESLFLIGYISYMDLVLSINVKFVVITAIGGEELLKGIFKNGGILMV